MFAAQRAVGVGRGDQGVPDPGDVFGEDVGFDGSLWVAGGCVVQGEQCPGDLVGPAPGGRVGCGFVMIGHGLQFAQDVRIMENSS